MSRTCDYELEGWDEKGKPLSKKLVDDLLGLMDEIGADNFSSEINNRSTYIGSFHTEACGASGEVEDALVKFTAEHPDILLNMDFVCQEEDIRSRNRYRNCEMETVNAVITYPPFTRLLLPGSGWILTDDDSQQYIRVLGNKRFECIQAGEMPTGTCFVTQRTVDLNDYDLDDAFCVSYLQSYGYDCIEDVQAQYGEDADQIIAECIFETEVWERDNIVYASTEDACRAYIQAVING